MCGRQGVATHKSMGWGLGKVQSDSAYSLIARIEKSLEEAVCEVEVTSRSLCLHALGRLLTWNADPNPNPNQCPDC